MIDLTETGKTLKKTETGKSRPKGIDDKKKGDTGHYVSKS
jgi:hypothetical protein